MTRRLAEMRTWGIRHTVFIRPGAWTPRSIGLVGEAAARVAEL